MFSEHPLSGIDGRNLGDYKIFLKTLIPSRIRECVRFVVALENKTGMKGNAWVVNGLYSAGRDPIKPWMDITYRDQIGFPPDGAISLYQEDLSPGLFKILGDLIPPGGHLMVSYDDGDPIHQLTERALALSFPPYVTPLGYLLAQAGFLSMKDWYWPEGGTEGPRKLWAERPLTPQIAHDRRKRMLEEVKGFLDRSFLSDYGEIGKTCSEITFLVGRIP